jgi:uncharacterized OB-fold protein
VASTHFKTPAITKLGRPFWEAAARGVLVIQRCDDCGAYIFYPSRLCDQCLSESLTWAEVTGRGTVESFSTVYRAFNAEFTEDVPYTVGLVRLEEGILLLTWLVGVEPDATEIGMPVEVTFERMSDEISLHRFRPVMAA